jgi:hypothetical protein
MRLILLMKDVDLCGKETGATPVCGGNGKLQLEKARLLLQLGASTVPRLFLCCNTRDGR